MKKSQIQRDKSGLVQMTPYSLGRNLTFYLQKALEISPAILGKKFTWNQETWCEFSSKIS